MGDSKKWKEHKYKTTRRERKEREKERYVDKDTKRE